MERETLSNNTEYQERLREARIKGVLGDRANTMMKELMTVSDYESRQLQQQVSETIQCSDLDKSFLTCFLHQLKESEQTVEYYQRKSREMEEGKHTHSS